MITGDVIRFLEKVPPFQFLDQSALGLVAGKVSMEFYPEGKEILTQSGPPSEYLYIICKGGVKVFFRSGNDEIAIDYRSEGECFGFVSLYSGDKSRTSVVAIEDTICYLISKETFLRIHDINPSFAEYFLKSYLGRYLDKTFDHMIEKGAFCKSGRNLPLTATVGDIATKSIITGLPDMTIQGAARVMVEHKVSSLVLMNESGLPVGIITDKDLREKVVASGLSITDSIREIMSFPLVTAQIKDYCFDAILKMIRHNIHHLLVMDGEIFIGILTNHDLLMLQGASPLIVARKIENCETVESLSLVAGEIGNVVAMLLKEGARAGSIARIITELNDRLVKKIIEIEIREHGPPPLPFCWIVFGSEGRKEQTFKTDQDNALIYANPVTDAEEEIAARYFTELAGRVNNALIKCGFPPCPAGYMASNPNWCQPLRIWKKYFMEWMTTSTPDAILLSTIFFDFRPVYGDFGLAETLRNHLIQMLKEEKFFLARMGAMIAETYPPLGFFRTFVVEKSGEHEDQLNLKVSAIALLVDIIRLFSLEKGTRETSTLERISALRGKHEIVDEFAHEFAQSFEFMMLLRVLHQLEQIESGIEPDNFIDPNTLSGLERRTLKEIFQLISRMQGLIDQRYRLGAVS